MKRRQLGNTLAIFFALLMLFVGYLLMYIQLFNGDFVGNDSIDDHILLFLTGIGFSFFSGMFIGFLSFNGDKKTIIFGIIILMALITLSYSILMAINGLYTISFLMLVIPIAVFGFIYLGSFLGSKLGLVVWDIVDIKSIEKIRKIWLLIKKQEYNLEEISKYCNMKIKEIGSIITKSLADAEDGYYSVGGGIYIDIIEGEISKDGLTFIPSQN